MLSAPLSIRLWIVAGVLVGATVLLHTVSHGEVVVARQPLRQLPSTLGAWNSQEQPLQERIVQAVGVSDYTGKFWMVADAITRNRTDGALVRLVTPMNDTESKARARLESFTQLVFPRLDELIPN